MPPPAVYADANYHRSIVRKKRREGQAEKHLFLVSFFFSYLRAEVPKVLDMVKLLASTLWTSLLRMAAMERMRCCVRGSIRRSVLKEDSNSFSPFPDTKRQVTSHNTKDDRTQICREQEEGRNERQLCFTFEEKLVKRLWFRRALLSLVWCARTNPTLWHR